MSCIKLASNESPFGPSPKAVEAIRRAAAEANYYPDNDTSELRLRLAEFHGVQPEQTLVTNGSTSLLGIMARALLGPGKNAVTSERTFIVYPIVTKSTGAKFIQVPTRKNGYDLDAIAAAVDHNTRLIFLANPNNPTGTMVDTSAVDAFLDKLPDHVVVALDEAYSDFASDFAEQRGVEYSHAMEYVRQSRNVVVLRTFSKAHGLAGIRVGYGVGPAELMTAFNKLRTTFSVSGVAEAAALAALKDTEHKRMTIKNNRAGAEFLSKKLRELGFEPLPTWGNFVFFESGEEALPLAKRIQAEGVIVRPMHTWGIPTGIRVTIGTPEQNEIFIAALAKAMEKSPVGR